MLALVQVWKISNSLKTINYHHYNDFVRYPQLLSSEGYSTVPTWYIHFKASPVTLIHVLTIVAEHFQLRYAAVASSNTQPSGYNFIIITFFKCACDLKQLRNWKTCLGFVFVWLITLSQDKILWFHLHSSSTFYSKNDRNGKEPEDESVIILLIPNLYSKGTSHW